MSASAADMPMSELSALNWSGFYLGAHVGAGALDGRASYADVEDDGAYDKRPMGWLAGLHAGYNWQIGRAVYGLEIEGSWADIDGYQSDLDGATFGFDTSVLASARFRSGIAIDNVLLFSSFGLAYANTDFDVVDTNPVGSGSSDFRHFGIASGFGAEWAFAPHWTLRGEYLYYWFRDRDNLAGLTGDSSLTDYARIDGIHTFRMGISYHFGGVSEPAISEAALDWSGFYLGAHAGYGMSRILGTYNEVGDDGSFDFDPSGILAGGQIGYNWQNGAWVYGLELDGSWSGMDDSRDTNQPAHQHLETTTLASLRGRLGIAASQQLFYVTGGLGYVRSKLTTSSPNDVPSPASVSISEFAPVIGSGVEWAFSPNWNVRLEGLTYFANKRRDLPTLTDESDPQDFLRQSTVKVIRLGINYRF